MTPAERRFSVSCQGRDYGNLIKEGLLEREPQRIAEAGQAFQEQQLCRVVQQRSQAAEDLAAHIEHLEAKVKTLETKVREQEEELEEMLKPDVERIGKMFGLQPSDEL